LDLDKSSGRQKLPARGSAAYPLIKENSAKVVGFWEVEMSTPAIGQSQYRYRYENITYKSNWDVLFSK